MVPRPSALNRSMVQACRASVSEIVTNLNKTSYTDHEAEANQRAESGAHGEGERSRVLELRLQLQLDDN